MTDAAPTPSSTAPRDPSPGPERDASRSTGRDSTRERLLDAAQRLYARRGLDAVSLREINQTAGARNATAVQYHFRDRAGIVRAILARYRPDIEARRHALLDAYEAAAHDDARDDPRGAARDRPAGGATDRAMDGAMDGATDGATDGAMDGATDGARDGRRTLAAALVRPLAARLADEGGRDFLQIWAAVLNRPDPIVPAAVLEDPADSLYRWRRLVEPLLTEDAARLHRRFTALLYSSIELGRRARSGPHADDRLFTSYLIDVVTAILGAPVSEETRRLAAERDAARGTTRGPRTRPGTGSR